jgi:hypothetical protein
MKEGKRTINILTGKLTGKRFLGRARCKWDDNITIRLKETDVYTQ